MPNLSVQTRYLLWTAAVGAFAGIALELIFGKVYIPMLFAAGAFVSAVLTSFIVYKLLLENRPKISTRRMLVSAFLIGTISHLVCWFIVYGVEAIRSGFYKDMVSGPLVMSFFSLLFFGWLTVGFSFVVGLIVFKPR